MMNHSNQQRSRVTIGVALLASALMLLLSLQLTTAQEQQTLDAIGNFTQVPLNITELSVEFLGAEYNATTDSTEFVYQLTNKTPRNFTNFILSVCQEFDREAILDHTPDTLTLDLNIDNGTESLLWRFDLTTDEQGTENSTFVFSIIIQGNVSVVNGTFYVTNETSIFNGTVPVPECIVEQVEPSPTPIPTPEPTPEPSPDQSPEPSPEPSPAPEPSPTPVPPVVCGPGLLLCGVQCYSNNSYVCFNNTFLCPIGHLKCGNDCYLPSRYVCLNETVLCPVSAPLRCGEACYNSARYRCEDGRLIQVPQQPQPSPSPSPVPSPEPSPQAQTSPQVQYS